jgi:putative protease
MARARQSWAEAAATPPTRKARLDVRVFGTPGSHLRAVFTADGESVTLRGETQLAPARQRSLDEPQLREQLGRLGNTRFVLGSIDVSGLAAGLFLPVSELNRLRQSAVEDLEARLGWKHAADAADRQAIIERAVNEVPAQAPLAQAMPARLVASVYTVDDARQAASAGATEIVLDPFLRHPLPPVSRVRTLASELTERGIVFRLRTPTIVRPEERRSLDKWLALETPILTGHLGLLAELSTQGRDVVADYAVNCFNAHTAAEYFRLGAARIVASIELTTQEIATLVAPWQGAAFDVVVYGRPEGMTIEHCVLSAAFDRIATSCRDLCVQKHPVVQITDPAGYSFGVATDTDCRNRLLHSRPVEGSEFMPRLWTAGIRGYHLLFNVPDEPVAALVSAYRAMLDELVLDGRVRRTQPRELVGDAFTRGHFARAV